MNKTAPFCVLSHENMTFVAIARYETPANATVSQYTLEERLYASFEFSRFEPTARETYNFNSLNCDVRAKRTPVIPKYIRNATVNIRTLSLCSAVKRLFSRLPNNNKPPALIPSIVLLKAAAASRTCSIKASLSFMERFPFQGMVKGWQLERCLAILGETLRPIPASRIYGGVK